MIRAGSDAPLVHLATRNLVGQLTLSACANVGVILTRDQAAVTCEACRQA